MLDKRNFYIDGKWVKPSKKHDYQVINPSNEEVFATISLGCERDLNTAVESAKKVPVSSKSYFVSISRI